MNLKDKIKIIAAMNGYSNTKTLCLQKIPLSWQTLYKLFTNPTSASAKTMHILVEATREYGKYAVVYDDFLPDLSISSDKSNNNNQNLNVKNTTPSVSSDDKQIDVVDTAETQSSEPSEVAKRKVGGK